MNRCERLIDYIKNKKEYGVGTKYSPEYLKRGVTVAEVQKVLGTTELRKIVCDLEEKGYKFEKVWEEGTNRFGDVTRYKRYFLVGRNNHG